MGTAARRAAAGAELFALLGGDLPIIVSGGRAWEGVVEADGLRDALVSHGVPQACIVRERCSLSTSDNARFTAMLLRRRGLSRVQIVTCAYHLPRAGALFRAHGLTVTCVPSDDGGASAASRIWRWGRERVCARIDGVTP